MFQQHYQHLYSQNLTGLGTILSPFLLLRIRYLDFLKKDWPGTKVNHRDLDSSLTFRNFLLSLEKKIHILRIEENKEKQNKMSHTERTKKCFPQPNEKDKNCIRKLLALFSRVEAFFFSHSSSEWSWPPCQHLTQYWFLRWKMFLVFLGPIEYEY